MGLVSLIVSGNPLQDPQTGLNSSDNGESVENNSGSSVIFRTHHEEMS